MNEGITVELYASGLGLMLYSPGAAARLEEGRDYMPPGAELAPPLRELVGKEQRVALLGTGSPQLDYVLHIQTGEPSASLVARSGSQVTFGLDIAGGELCIRDGYDPMEWHADDQGVRRVPMSDGYYAVNALWIPERQGAMTVHLFFQRTNERLPGNGWPFLEYRVQ